MRNKGFTLIELLVVIAIIGLLASVVLVSMFGLQGKAKITKTLEFSQSLQRNLGAYAVGVWSFDEGSGTTVKDGSGYNNNGTLMYGPTFTSDTPHSAAGVGTGKYALSFNGTSNYVSVPSSSELTNAALGYTVEVWIKPEVDDDYWTGVVGKPGRNYNFWLGESNDSSGGYVHHRFHTTADGNNYCPDTGANSIAMGQWSHVVLTNNGSTCRTYINGEIKTERTFTASLVADSTQLYIGRNLDGGASNYYRGTIDEVRIYEKALSLGEIQKRYADGLQLHSLVLE